MHIRNTLMDWLHGADTIPNGIAVVPMSDDADTVVVANPEEQSTTSSSSSAAEVRAALASIGATTRDRATPSGLSMRSAVFVRDEMVSCAVLRTACEVCNVCLLCSPRAPRGECFVLRCVLVMIARLLYSTAT